LELLLSFLLPVPSKLETAKDRLDKEKNDMGGRGGGWGGRGGTKKVRRGRRRKEDERASEGKE
jgi:hypothetical protein